MIINHSEQATLAAAKAILLVHFTEEQAEEIMAAPGSPWERREAVRQAEVAVAAYLAVACSNDTAPHPQPPRRGGDC